MKPQDRTRTILRSGLDPETKLIAIAIADCMDDQGAGSFVSIETGLPRATGLSKITIYRRVAAAVQAGWLVRLGVNGATRREWRIHWSQIHDAVRPRSEGPGTPICETGDPCQRDRPTPVSGTDDPCPPDRRSDHDPTRDPTPLSPPCEGGREERSQSRRRRPHRSVGSSSNRIPSASEHGPPFWRGDGPMPRQTALDLFGAYASVFRECGEEAVVGVVCTLDEWMQAQSAATLRLAAAHGEVIAEEAIP